jgi:ribonuclease HI
MIELHVDAAGGKKLVGLGAAVLVDGKKIFSLGTAAKPGRTTVEAEFLAVFWGFELICSMIENGILKKGQGLLIHTDSKSVADCIYSINKTRSQRSRSLAKRIIKEADKMTKTGIVRFFRFTLVKGSENQADNVAKSSRRSNPAFNRRSGQGSRDTSST